MGTPGNTVINISENEGKLKPQDFYELIRNFSNACDHSNIEQINALISKKKLSITEPSVESISTNKLKLDFKNHSLAVIFQEFRRTCPEDSIDLVFCSAVQFDLEKLTSILTKFTPQKLNQLRFSDTILFALKYGNIMNPNFEQVMKHLIEASVNINIIDIKGKSAIDYIARFYERFETELEHLEMLENLLEVAELMLKKGLFKMEENNTKRVLTHKMKLNLKQFPEVELDNKTKLFSWINKYEISEFLSFSKISKYANCDNSENTLLQLASKKSDSLAVVQHLLANGADPNKTCEGNSLTPIELAAMQNNVKIFEELLNHRKTEINQEQFNNFVRWRAKPMKPKLFEILLESDKLDPTFSYEKTGNTPLHYAVYFSHKKAIQNLLTRSSSLLPRNSKEKRIVDLIDASDMETYFDSCLAFDNYTPYFTDFQYKMRFRFNCLIDNESNREVKVISNIGKQPNLEYLLTHPLVHIFINLKWYNTRIYYRFILIMQAIIYLVLGTFFYRYPNGTTELVFAIIFSLIHIVIKIRVFLWFNKSITNHILFPAMEHATFHSIVEILLIIIIVGSFISHQFRAFVFTAMTISFLLTAGYHPRLSKWSIMLQQVFKSFSVLLIFFSMIIISYSIGFRILFTDTPMFQNMTHAIIATYVMTVGEFNSNDIQFELPGTAGYLLFFLFAMSVSLVIVNFWTGVAVTDIERIEKHSEINSFKNVIIFMLFIDYIYIKMLHQFNGIPFLKKYLPRPLLFLNIDNKNPRHSLKYEIDFYPNKEKQFGGLCNLPNTLEKNCFTKLEKYYHTKQRQTSEDSVQAKLSEILELVQELKEEIKRNRRSPSSQGDFKMKSKSPEKKTKHR